MTLLAEQADDAPGWQWQHTSWDRSEWNGERAWNVHRRDKDRWEGSTWGSGPVQEQWVGSSQYASSVTSSPWKKSGVRVGWNETERPDGKSDGEWPWRGSSASAADAKTHSWSGSGGFGCGGWHQETERSWRSSTWHWKAAGSQAWEGDGGARSRRSWQASSRSEKPLRLLGENTGEAWTPVVWDEKHRSFSQLLSNSMDERSQAYFFEKASTEVEWLQQNEDTPRRTAWMVKPPCTCEYCYGGEAVRPTGWPQWLEELMLIVMPQCGLEAPEMWPNSCNLNFYEDASQSLGWHADDESLFQGWFQDCAIISLSLGSTRTFEIYGPADWPEEETEGCQELPAEVTAVELQGGDLLTMEGLFQRYYKHRVPASWDEDEEALPRAGPRVNLTWRWILEHLPECKLLTAPPDTGRALSDNATRGELGGDQACCQV